MKRRNDMNTNPTRRNEAGFSLVELMIATAVLLFMFGSAYALILTTSKTTKVTSSLSQLNQKAYRTLERIAEEVMPSGLAQFQPIPASPVGSSSITFRRCTGYAAAAIQWGAQRSITLEYEPEDPNDGIDNDGDGLVDEGVIVWRRNPGTAQEQTQVIARGVAEFLSGEVVDNADNNGNGLEDERGLSFVLEGSKLIIRLTLQGVGSDNQVVSRTVETAVTFRN